MQTLGKRGRRSPPHLRCGRLPHPPLGDGPQARDLAEECPMPARGGPWPSCGRPNHRRGSAPSAPWPRNMAGLRRTQRGQDGQQARTVPVATAGEHSAARQEPADSTITAGVAWSKVSARTVFTALLCGPARGGRGDGPRPAKPRRCGACGLCRCSTLADDCQRPDNADHGQPRPPWRRSASRPRRHVGHHAQGQPSPLPHERNQRGHPARVWGVSGFLLHVLDRILKFLMGYRW